MRTTINHTFSLRTAFGSILLSLLWAGLAIAQPATEAGKIGQGVWLNYDFQPASQVLFFTDFSEDPVGSFPERLVYIKGNMEVAEWQDRHWLRGSGGWAEFEIPLAEPLPDRFSLEIEYFGDSNSNILTLRFVPETNGNYAYWAAHRSGIKGNAPKVNAWARTDEGSQDRRTRPFYARLMVDGDAAKVYTDAIRTANSPAAPIGRSDTVYVRIPSVSRPAMIGSIRITGGPSKVSEELLGSGRAVARGVYFDPDSASLRNESAPTLREICATMTEHGDLRVQVGGHTDDQGDDAHNLDLSQRRAESMRTYLIDDCGIAAERVEAMGFGKSDPVSTNDTAEGRQQNRRVELTVPE